MKTLSTALFALTAATALSAHGNAFPHTHDASGTNWLPAVAAIGSLALLGVVATRLRNNRRAAAKVRR